MAAAHMSFAQQTAIQARQYMAEKNYTKAIEIYNTLYGNAPDSVYTEYFSALMEAQKYKEAEKLVEKQLGRYKVAPPASLNNIALNVDLGVVYEKLGKESKAKEQYEKIVQLINGDAILTDNIVKAFSAAGKDDYAIRAYERTVQLTGNIFSYGRQLAMLYNKTGNLDKAIDVLLVGAPGQYMNSESVKALLLEMLGTDQKKMQQAQKILVKKINEQPENVSYAEILTWVYTQRDDWEGALIQMQALDERYKESGKRLLELARIAAHAKQYDIAAKAYDEAIERGKGTPNYVIAKSEKLNTSLTQLENNHAWKPEDVNAVIRQYDSFFVEFPQYYNQPTALDYAMLYAQYGGNVPKGIEILNKSLASPDTRRNTAAQLKLQLGDYYLLNGKLWDASLTYSQVDKDFKQDEMGENARFKNAKLAYYRGDFDWAQKQLSILKASTSQLIANDALYLSVLITENVQDSNMVPLERFAYADLLLYQNKDKQAESLLDSLTAAFPKHPLNDDIIMQRARITIKHREFDKALKHLEAIVKDYGQDVLGDDAVYKMAEIYQDELHQAEAAKRYYEQLIIDYPGSTYVQMARQKLNAINNPVAP
jgi:predicted Zn-dependent protease